MKKLIVILILTLVLFVGDLARSLPLAAQTATGTPEALRQSIEEKTKELDQVNKEIQKTEANISQTKTQSRTIQKDVQNLSANINQLNLKIKAGEITIDKLRLELNQLGIEVKSIEESVAGKKEGIAASLRTIQQKDNEGLLIMFLSGRSLADSVFEAQSLSSLNEVLAGEILNLKSLQDSLSQKIFLTAEKKSNIEGEHANTKNRKEIVGDQKTERERLLNFTKTQQRTYESQLTKLEKQQADMAEEIDKLEDELRKTFNVSLLPEKRPGVLSMPIQNPRITQNWGEISNLYRGKPHNGLDIGAPIGTPIFAARDGKVTAVGNNGRLQYGRYILIEHDNGLSTLYAHLSRQAAIQGATVKRGEVIGYVGNTGYSFGSHLHLGLYWSNSIKMQSFSGAGLVPVGVTLNPRDYI